MSLAHRIATAEDMPCVVDTWLDSFRSSWTAGLIQMHQWWDVMRPQVHAILGRPGCEIWVAHNPNSEGTLANIYGWIAVEHGYRLPVVDKERVAGRWVRTNRTEAPPDPLVHYCYVKKWYRRQGVARGLFQVAGVDPSEPFYFTCKTMTATRLLGTGKAPGASWQPLIARHQKERVEHADASREQKGPIIEWRENGHTRRLH